LREVWLNIGVEKIDTHEGIVIKAFLDSGAMGMFMDKQMAARYGFKLQKLERPLVVRNVDGTNNSRGAITHQVECNVFYKGYMERMRMDVCDLGKTEVILEMPWLAAHNPEINWETVMGDQREFDLETRVTTNGNNKTPRCFTVVH